MWDLPGMSVKVCAYQVATQNYDIYVLELSSFQLDGMYDFKADIAILLNITLTTWTGIITILRNM